MRELIYLDHNATTPLLPRVVDAMLPYLRSSFGNPSSDHPAGHAAKRAVANAREQVAALIGAQPDEVVFTSGGTESNNLAILGGAAAAAPTRRSVVTSAVEHPATVQPVGRLERRGWSILRLPVTGEGAVRSTDSAAAITGDVALVTMILAQNETGAIMPIVEAGEQARAAGALMHTDAAQAVGKIPVDVAALHVDLLSIAGHKINAPKGVGALYIRRGTSVEPVLVGASQEQGVRPGTENVAGIVGLGEAAAASADDLLERQRNYGALRDRLWAGLQAAVPGITRFTPDTAVSNTLSVSFPGVRGADVLARAPFLAASTGSACHTGEEDPSAAILAMGVDPAQAMGTVRLSVGYGTTDEDVTRAMADLAAAYAAL